jgi:hypothetical protein
MTKTVVPVKGADAFEDLIGAASTAHGRHKGQRDSGCDDRQSPVAFSNCGCV